MEKPDVRKILQPIVWDYNVDPYDVYEVALGRKEQVGSFTRRKALLRMFERLSWYDLLRLFGIECVGEFLTADLIRQLRFPELRDRYELVRKVLHGEPVSFSGWSPEYRQKSDTPFYLTGGTALSRGYFQHRYSDDLNLFVNQDSVYPAYVQGTGKFSVQKH